MMKMSYVSEVQKNMKTRHSIYASQKTSRILDGSYLSIYQGRSLNFDELREYHPGDEVRDIDWKASARSQKTLVRQYIAERKHNILFLFDTNPRMQAHTAEGSAKSELGWLAAGIIACFAQKNGDYIGAMMGKENGLERFPFHTDLYHLEMMLAGYDHISKQKNKVSLLSVLEHVLKEEKRRSILFVVTDLKGMSEVSSSLMRKLEIMHDLLFIVVDDTDLGGEGVFDIETDTILPAFLTKNKNLVRVEQKNKLKLIKDCENRLNQNAVQFVIVNRKDNIEMKMIELLEKHRSER